MGLRWESWTKTVGFEVCTIDSYGDPPVGRGASAPFCRDGTIPAHGRSSWDLDPEQVPLPQFGSYCLGVDRGQAFPHHPGAARPAGRHHGRIAGPPRLAARHLPAPPRHPRHVACAIPARVRQALPARSSRPSRTAQPPPAPPWQGKSCHHERATGVEPPLPPLA